MTSIEDVDTDVALALAAVAAEAPPVVGALLQVEDMSVEFDGFKALNGVNLSVEEGELRFLIGPNGAGKTTLVDVVTGLTKASTGRVRFAGEDITGRRAHRIVQGGIGRSFQTPTVFEKLTVIENLDLAESFKRPFVSLFRRRRGVSDGVAGTLERIGLASAGDRVAGSLSHGQKQWLEIGALLVQKPRLLLLDEPVAGMSPQERLDTGALLQELAAEATIIVIEHDMAFLRRFAHRVTVLHEGRILAEGSVSEVQADPMVRQVYLGRSRDERSGRTADTAPDVPEPELVAADLGLVEPDPERAVTVTLEPSADEPSADEPSAEEPSIVETSDVPTADVLTADADVVTAVAETPSEIEPDAGLAGGRDMGARPPERATGSRASRWRRRR